jgi:hypothetical protein
LKISLVNLKIKIMPGFDRTGPEGQGSQTGRKMGKCNPNKQGTNEQLDVDETSSGFGRRFGRGVRKGFGFGRGTVRSASRGLGRRNGRGNA